MSSINSNNVIALDLTNVQETLFTPLCARADQWGRPDAIVEDKTANELVRQLPYDFEKIRRYPNTLTGCAIRAAIMDGWIRNFTQTNPEGSVGLLGVGLDTTFERNRQFGNVDWFEFDYEDVITLRRKCFKDHPKRHLVNGDIFNTAWIDRVKAIGNGPWLFQAAGVLMYLKPEKVNDLFHLLGKHFPGSTFLFDGCSNFAKRNSHRWEATVRTTSAQYHWSIDNPRLLAAKFPGLKVTDVEYLMDHHRHQWQLNTRFWSAVLPKLRRGYHISRAIFSAGPAEE